jgi:hypothetical protein
MCGGVQFIPKRRLEKTSLQSTKKWKRFERRQQFAMRKQRVERRKREKLNESLSSSQTQRMLRAHSLPNRSMSTLLIAVDLSSFLRIAVCVTVFVMQSHGGGRSERATDTAKETGSKRFKQSSDSSPQRKNIEKEIEDEKRIVVCGRECGGR